MAVNSLISMPNKNERYNAILLLNKIFDDPNPKLRLKFMKWLSISEMYYPLFLFIQEELIKSKNRILMKYRTDSANKNDKGKSELLNFYAAISLQTEKHLLVSDEIKDILNECLIFM